jgi:hypothetical protein
MRLLQRELQQLLSGAVGATAVVAGAVVAGFSSFFFGCMRAKIMAIIRMIRMNVMNANLNHPQVLHPPRITQLTSKMRNNMTNAPNTIEIMVPTHSPRDD